MKKIFLVLLAVCVASGAASSLPAAENPEKAARKSAIEWLALVDAGKYGESWTEASEAFKAAVSRTQWQDAS
jgi:hypothetical protein